MRLFALNGVVDVDLSESGLDEAEFQRLWSRCLAPEALRRSLALTLRDQPESRSLSVAGDEGASDDEGPEVVVAGANASFVALTQQITRAFIAKQQGRLLMFHAGCVTNPSTGGALVYVAPGGTGKSTLTTKLGREYGYVTDETVAVDPVTRQIHPYPKPVTWAKVRGEAKIEHAPEDLGLQEPGATPVLTSLVLLRRKDDLAEATFTPLDTVEAITMLTPETSSLSSLEDPLATLAELIADVGCTLIEYGDGEQILSWCRERLDGSLPESLPEEGRSLSVAGEERASDDPSRGVTAATSSPPAATASDDTSRTVQGGVDAQGRDPSTRRLAHGAHAAAQGAEAGRSLSVAGEERASDDEGRGPIVALAPTVDTLIINDEALALTGPSLLRLGPISTAIVEILRESPVALGELLAELEAQFGSPEGISLEDAVDAQLTELRAQGVVAE